MDYKEPEALALQRSEGTGSGTTEQNVDTDSAVTNESYLQGDETTVYGDMPDISTITSASYGVTVILSVITLYAAVTQIVYCAWIRKKLLRRCQPANITSILAAVFTFLRVSYPSPYVISRCNHTEACKDASHGYKMLTYDLSLALSWMTLWLRQRLFYNEPMFRERTGNTPIVVSKLIPFVIFGTISLNTVIFYAGRGRSISKALWITSGSVSLLAGLVVLLLLIYPLATFMRNSDARSNHRGNVEKSAITAAVLIPCLCLVVQLTASLVQYLGPEDVSNITNDVAATGVMLAVLASSTGFKEKLAPWNLPQKRNEERRRTIITTTRR